MHILGLIRCISWTKDAIIEYQNAGNHMVFLVWKLETISLIFESTLAAPT